MPVRLCVQCRTRAPRNELLRLHADAQNGNSFDLTLRGEGRGFYVHVEPACLKGLSRRRYASPPLTTANVLAQIQQQLDQDKITAQKFKWMDDGGGIQNHNRVTRRIQRFRGWLANFDRSRKPDTPNDSDHESVNPDLNEASNARQ
ncbi:MAG: hypothetical protein CMH54_07315 [Myxococcales bacterium]|nr:hypothetical protein [Myxococcales bacterium]